MTSTWQPVGPLAVDSANYGLTAGRVTSLAVDPADPTGNRLLVGTTGGGVWAAQNAASGDLSQITFSPLTDAALPQIQFAPPTISIGALSIQPGNTGVLLAGTGDPNDALDSYYGDGILRSTDNGHTWTRIERSADQTVPFSFVGLGFAGFAWSTTNPSVAVAAVSRAYEAGSVGAETSHLSYAGLYYSSDAGATWRLAEIKDQNGQAIQGPLEAWAGDDGNAATSVVWNPVRRLFLAAVQFHGYYSSPDGINWTRLAAQPGLALTNALCPTNHGLIGSTGCPIFRGTLAVNPTTGDTFAWSVDINNQDQGLWQDVCAASGGACTNSSITFSKQWSTTPLQTNTWQGSATVQNGDYNLALAAVPSGQDTLLFLGGNDLWKCSLAMGCVWRNTTNANTCMSAAVAPYQHAFAWNPANPQELFVGNDSGLWRSMDAVNESGSACSSADASHWQNLNVGLGSLAEVESLSAASPTTLLAGFGANGTAGVSGGSTVPSQWPQILGGEGGPVAIDPSNPLTWYVNNGAGVSIHVCTKGASCSPADFGASPVVSNATVNNDGWDLYAPAPFVVDPLDPTQLIIGTCRIWRGPASGQGWTTADAVSSMFDGNTANASCHGNALVRSLAAIALPHGGEVIYASMYGHFDGGATVSGHVFRGVMDSNGAWSWQDLTQNPVSNEQYGFNAFHYGVSSIFIDPADPTGNSVYVTIAALRNSTNLDIDPIYRTTDGGAHWKGMRSNLPNAPANSIAVDPSNSEWIYAATDAGVFVTQTASTCGDFGVNCWGSYGTGLPQSPVVALNVLPTAQMLLAGTYGRGIWQIPLLGTPPPSTTASVQPASLTFPAQADGTTSSPLSITLTNTGTVPLLPASVEMTGDFSEADTCVNAAIAPGDSCGLQVTFTPSAPSSRTGQLTILANISGGSLTVGLSGTGVAPGPVYFVPALLNFGNVQVGSKSATYSVMIENSTSSSVAIQSLSVAGPFTVTSNACGSGLLPASDCQILLQFAPTAAGSAEGILTVVDDQGTQTAHLQGMGTSPPTDTLSAGSLTFPGTIIGQPSSPLTLSLTNSGSTALTAIQQSVTGPFSVSSNCTTQLIGGSSCSIGVTFTPTAQGTQAGVLTVSDALRTQTVSLSGTGLLPPVLAANPASLTFGSQLVAQASAPLSVTISNNGGAPLAGLGFQFTGANAASFSVTSGTCSTTLAAGASCAAQVVFTPSVTGPASATLVASSSTAGVSPVSVALSASGVAAAGLTLSPAQLTFASQPVGISSAPQTVTITNNTASSATGLLFLISGPFTVAQNSCGSTLAPSASCVLTVIFKAAQTGPASGTLTVHASSIAPDATVALVGTGGLTGVLQAQPGSIAFPITGLGSTSSPVTITIVNSSATYPLDNFAIAPSDAFQVTSNCGASLAPNGSCTASVTFTPIAVGAKSGSLTISSSALAANVAVPLSGTGFDFAFTASGSTTQSVISGQSASYTFDLSPAAISVSFTFACASLPQYASCVFSPSSASVAANGTATETVQITTSQTSASAQPPARMGWKPIVLACGLLCLPFVARKRRAALLSLLIGLCVTAIASCAGAGGGGGSSPPTSSTAHTVAPGTYSIQVQATANGLQHAATVKLTVN